MQFFTSIKNTSFLQNWNIQTFLDTKDSQFFENIEYALEKMMQTNCLKIEYF